MSGTRVIGGHEPVRVYTHCLPKGFERPSAYYRLNAVDQGRILRHGDGPNGCDALFMREPIVYESGGLYNLHYDACGSTSGYCVPCLAISRDLAHWDLKGPAIPVASPGQPDGGGAASPWFVFDGQEWHMFYWSKDLNRWDPRHKAVVIDGQNCTWASGNIGMASVVKVGNRLAVFYDAREGSEINHFHRDIGLAWLDLPLIPITKGMKE